MKKILFSLMLLAVMFGVSTPASASLSFPSVANLDHGDLIKTTTSSSVYYFADNEMRYGFPNEATFFTWYDDFHDVKTISTTDMGLIPLGGMATYKPQLGNDGPTTRLLKLSSQSTVYVPIGNGMLAALKNEDYASAIMGSTWPSLVDTLPDAFANNYTILGGFLSMSTEFIDNIDINGYSISFDKELSNVSGVMMYEDPLRFAGYDEAGSCVSQETCCADDYCGFNVVKVDQGDTVKFVNYTNETLTIQEEDGLWSTGKMDPGDIKVMRINLDEGDYNFRAKEDWDMMGVMVVE